MSNSREKYWGILPTFGFWKKKKEKRPVDDISTPSFPNFSDELEKSVSSVSSTLKEVLQESPPIVKRSVREVLRIIRPFKTLSVSQLDEIAVHFSMESFQPHSFIYRKGEKGDSMSIIFSGKVRVPVTDESGEEKSIVYLKPGDIIGEMAMMTGEGRRENVIAETETQLLTLKHDKLLELFQEFPSMADFLTDIIAYRLSEGQRKIGKYQVLDELGQGGTSYVYKAYHPELDRLCALKMLKHEMSMSPKFRERFKNEAKIIAQLNHPNIVQVFDVEQAFGTHFVVMELVEGGTLKDLLTEYKEMEKPKLLSVEACRDIAKQMATALAYAHSRGIVHRDVKPGNVLIDPFGVVKIMDFGLACNPGNIPKQTIVGTPMYMSPEHIESDTIDQRADIYSYGIVLYEMLTGQSPFRRSTAQEVFKAHIKDPLKPPKELFPDIPDYFNEIVVRATEKNPDDRFQSMDEVIRILDQNSALSLQNGNEALLALYISKDLEQKVEPLVEEFRRKMLAKGIPLKVAKGRG